MPITVQQMRVLVALADVKSFTGAAKRLHVTQPAISRALSEAERILRIDVFDRSSKSLLPTERGAAIVAIARKALDEVDRATIKMNDIASGAQRKLRISALPTVAAVLLPDVTAHLRAIDTEIELEIFTARAESVVEMVRTGKADIGITVRSDGIVPDTFTPMFMDELLCATSTNHRFGSMQSVTWRDLSQETLVRLPSDSSIERLTENAFQTQGVTPRHSIVTFDLMSAAGLAASAVGVAVIPALAAPMTQFAKLSYTKLNSPRVTRTIGIVSNSPLTPEERLISVKATEVAVDVLDQEALQRDS